MKGVASPSRRANGGSTVIVRRCGTKPGNKAAIELRDIPRTFGLRGLLYRKSYQTIAPPGRKTRRASEATFIAIFWSRIELKTVKKNTRSKLASANGNISPLTARNLSSG